MCRSTHHQSRLCHRHGRIDQCLVCSQTVTLCTSSRLAIDRTLSPFAFAVRIASTSHSVSGVRDRLVGFETTPGSGSGTGGGSLACPVSPAPTLNLAVRADVGCSVWVQPGPPNTASSAAHVLVRLQRQYWLDEESEGEVRITGIVYLPERAGDPVASPMLRNLPTSWIEAAINRRQFAVTGASRFEGGTMTMPSGRILRSEDVMKPLGNPKRTPDFYEVVALQHTRLVDDGEANPSARMADISRVPLSTAQGGVARARRKGLLPPARCGRAG